MEPVVEDVEPLETGDIMTLSQRRRAVAAATIGNGLEFYDFITYAFFAIQIGKTFFPSSSPFLSLMGSLATFGAGFITRPLGAHVLGGYADTHGRKPAMLISMAMMGAGILLLALTPGYAQIGYAAPVIAVCARLIQGFALGGEVGSASIYMMESSTSARRGYTMSWQGASQGIAATVGSLVGLGLSLVMSEGELADYGWRIALLLGALIVPFALVIRNSLPETLGGAHGSHAAAPAAAPLASYARPVVCGFLIIASGTIATYIFNYMATYGQNTLGLSTSVSMAGEFVNNGIGVIAVMIGGWMSDRHGRRPIMLWAQGLLGVLILPCFLWLTTARDAGAFIGVNLVLSAVGSFHFGAIYAAISESLPRAVRARVFALVYSVPVALFGGTTQMVVTWMLHVTGNPLSIAWYLTGVTFLGLAAMVAMRESAPVRAVR
ncbi:MAG: MFS transporter [Novosphingobium sp.]